MNENQCMCTYLCVFVHKYLILCSLCQLMTFAQENSVLPTTFGIGWTKLLFSRQFPSDFLILWDAIVAAEFTLIEPLLASMVLALRTLLMDGDSCRCNVLLVSKYPQSVDVKFVLSLALHLHMPEHHEQPRR